MEFFNKLGKKASEAYKVTADKTGKLAKEAKLRMKMGELKSEINTIYEEIGKVVYENHVREEKEDTSKILDEKCTKIDCLSDEIESILKECLELKDRRQCQNCYAEIDRDAKFCPECGAKQEENEETAKDVEIVEEQKDSEETKNENNEQQENNSDEKSDLEEIVEVESNVNLKDDETVEHLNVEDE